MTRHVTSYWAALSRIFSICHATSRYITLPYRTVKLQLCSTTLRYIACIQPSSSVHQLFLCNNNNRYQLSGYCGDRNGFDSEYMDRLFWKWPSSMCICDNRQRMIHTGVHIRQTCVSPISGRSDIGWDVCVQYGEKWEMCCSGMCGPGSIRVCKYAIFARTDTNTDRIKPVYRATSSIGRAHA